MFYSGPNKHVLMINNSRGWVKVLLSQCRVAWSTNRTNTANWCHKPFASSHMRSKLNINHSKLYKTLLTLLAILICYCYFNKFTFKFVTKRQFYIIDSALPFKNDFTLYKFFFYLTTSFPIPGPLVALVVSESAYI